MSGNYRQKKSFVEYTSLGDAFDFVSITGVFHLLLHCMQGVSLEGILYLAFFFLVAIVCIHKGWHRSFVSRRGV